MNPLGIFDLYRQAKMLFICSVGNSAMDVPESFDFQAATCCRENIDMCDMRGEQVTGGGMIELQPAGTLKDQKLYL